MLLFYLCFKELILNSNVAVAHPLKTWPAAQPVKISRLNLADETERLTFDL
jgi:hypothetical protein